MGSWPGWCPAVLARPPAHHPAANRVAPGSRSAGPCSSAARSMPWPSSTLTHRHVVAAATHLLQPPPDLRLLVQLGLQHLLLLAGQLHLLFDAFLLLYLLKAMSKAIPSPGNRPPSPPEGELGSAVSTMSALSMTWALKPTCGLPTSHKVHSHLVPTEQRKR